MKIVDIDRNNKIVLLENRKQLEYEKLIIATGSVVNKLNTSSREDRSLLSQNDWGLS